MSPNVTGLDGASVKAIDLQRRIYYLGLR